MALLADDDSFELALDLAKPFEGLRLSAYHDPVGYPTQGFGRLLSRIPWEPLDRWPDIDEATAESWLAEDMLKAARAVWRLCPVPMEQHQLAALYDFAFNCGAGNLQTSSLRQCVLRGDFRAAQGQFCKWVYARGAKLSGLVRRRAAEARLFGGEA